MLPLQRFKKSKGEIIIMESEVKTNVERAQKKQKLHYDRKHGAGDLFTIGSLVLKRISEDGGEKVERWTIAGRVHL